MWAQAKRFLAAAAGRIIVTAPGPVAALLLAADRLSIPSKDFWQRNERLLVAAYITVFLVSFIAPLRAAWRRAQRSWADRGERVRESVEQAWVEIDRETQDLELPWHKIGLHVWEVRPHPRARPPFFEKRLTKLTRLRISKYWTSTGIAWTKGKGAIGICWAEQAVVFADASGFASYAVGDRSSWEALPEARRYGLSWQEMQGVQGYGAVIAVPVIAGPEFKGCVSLDGPPGCYETISSPEVVDLLTDLANSVAAQLY